ncbi:MAG: hypothetical protein WCG16_12670 [Methylococcales bacterium]
MSSRLILIAILLFGFQSYCPAAPVKSAAAPATLNPLATVMGSAGVSHCQGRVQQVTEFLTNGANSGATLLLPTDYLNDHLVSASLEVIDGPIVFYANVDFAPLVAYGCDASFESVVYWPDSCEKVAKVQFKEAKNTGKMRQQISVLTASSNNLQIFLMPAGNGCVSIKKQAIFDRF